MTGLRGRIHDTEMMDDPSVSREDLHRTLHDLATLNRYFGVHDILRRHLVPALERLHDNPLKILDVGTGLGDGPIALLQGTTRDLTITATDNSQQALNIARDHASRVLNTDKLQRITFEKADLYDLHYPDNSFDVVMACQVIHHFSDEEIPRVIARLAAIARHGVFIQDLHRHRIPLLFISAASRLMNLSPLVQNDGPISVRKGFQKDDFGGYFRSAGLSPPTVRWHPTFRWIVSTLPTRDG